MYASGSTWLYNAARQTALAAGLEMRSCYAETLKMLEPVRQSEAGVRIVKSHQLDAPAAAFMGGHAEVILLTIRDPRDAVVSLMQHMRHGFGAALQTVGRSAAFCGRFADDPRTHVLRYEGGFIDDPTTFDRLAGLMGTQLPAGARERLFANSRRAAIEARIASFAALPGTVADPRSGDVVELESQWHLHHVGRSGESGRWRRLLSPQAALVVEQRFSGWMAHFGYQPAASAESVAAPRG